MEVAEEALSLHLRSDMTRAATQVQDKHLKVVLCEVFSCHIQNVLYLKTEACYEVI